MAQLTKAWIDKSAPKAKDYIIWDDIVKGFGCRIYSTKKTFIYRYRSPQDKRIISIKIGVYGSVTVEEARMQAKKFAHSVQIEKIDPKELKKTKEVEAQQSVLFEDFWQVFTEKYIKKHQKQSTIKNNSSKIKNYILPFFGKKPIDEIQRKDILEFNNLLFDLNIKNTKNLDLLNTAFNQAEIWEYRPFSSNPCRGVPKDPDKMMDRFLTDEELVRLEKTLLATEAAGLVSPAILIL
jgi:hypothetical protein